MWVAAFECAICLLNLGSAEQPAKGALPSFLAVSGSPLPVQKKKLGFVAGASAGVERPRWEVGREQALQFWPGTKTAREWRSLDDRRCRTNLVSHIRSRASMTIFADSKYGYQSFVDLLTAID